MSTETTTYTVLAYSRRPATMIDEDQYTGYRVFSIDIVENIVGEDGQHVDTWGTARTLPVEQGDGVSWDTAVEEALSTIGLTATEEAVGTASSGIGGVEDEWEHHSQALVLTAVPA